MQVEVSSDRTEKNLFRVAFFTCAPVAAGAELTWSYGKTYGSRKTDQKCHCGADTCGGWMP
jgi:SET domain-containing protein